MMNLRPGTQRLWWLAAPAAGLVLALNFWCQLHGSVLGRAAVRLDVSLPWALNASLGWIVAAAVLQFAGARLFASAPARSHPWLTRIGIVLATTVVTLTGELLLLRGDTPIALWLYERLPLHALFAALLTGAFVVLFSRRLARETPESAEQLDDLVEVMTGTGRTRVRIEDIECLEAERNYINVHTPDRSYLLRRTLASLEKSLGAHDFQRVHRSIIVNRARIRERRPGGVLVLSSGRTVRVSRGFAQRLN